MVIDARQEKLSFQAEVKQLLNIVIHSFYSNKEIFLRELVSNASDAIDKLRFEALSDPALLEVEPDLVIRIRFDKEARTITISDNGIGMSRDEVMSHLGTIAQSGTREFLSHLTGDQKKDAHLIGQFGVGFYSAFLVADRVTVLTRRAGLEEEHGVQWESTGDGEYTIANVKKVTRGTEVTLHLRPEEDEFLSHWHLRGVITKYSDYLNLPIQMLKLADDEKVTDEWETINRVTALWVQSKASVTDEQYKEFYKHISHDFEEPLAWTQHKVEGSHEYTTLLYLPAHTPFDFWQRDKQHGLKLYVQRVFIMDQVDRFMPQYLRFVRGIVDTTALPLNISREILQDHPTISKLRSALTRHVLDLLERLAKDEPEKYARFWQEFGVVLKEGPAEDFAHRARIAKLFRFSTTRTDEPEQKVTLDEYVGRMPATQKKIYYITADTFNAAKSSPHLEIFRKNNIEVLLLSDRVDEWWVGHLAEFDGKSLQSVAKGELNLEEIVHETVEEKKDEGEEKKQQQQFDELLKKIQTILADQVKEVRLSHRLTASPVCLVRDANALGPQMERLLKAAGQEVTAIKPIMELNPTHRIICKLQEKAQDDQTLQEWTQLLYEQALLAEGSPLPDPAAFVQRVNTLWMEVV